jgi:hypothetical protein
MVQDLGRPVALSMASNFQTEPYRGCQQPHHRAFARETHREKRRKVSGSNYRCSRGRQENVQPALLWGRGVGLLSHAGARWRGSQVGQRQDSKRRGRYNGGSHWEHGVKRQHGFDPRDLKVKLAYGIAAGFRPLKWAIATLRGFESPAEHFGHRVLRGDGPLNFSMAPL